MITLGDRVFYTLNSGDVARVVRQRRDGNNMPGTTHGNDPREGQTCPADVVRVFDEDAGVVNLRVLLDGDDVLWVTSAYRGDPETRGFWSPRERGTT